MIQQIQFLKNRTKNAWGFFVLIGLFILQSFLHAQVTTFPFAENFNTNSTPSGWSQEQVVGTNNWNFVSNNGSNTVAPRSGTYMAEFRNTTRGNATKLVTPELNLTSLTVPYLEFYAANVNWGNDIDELKIYYKTSASGPWVIIDSIKASHPNWVKFEFSLPNPTATYYVAFEGISNYGRGFDLDDIVIKEGPAACVGSPLLGIASSDKNLVCANEAFKLTIPKGINSGLTYRWEASTDGGVNWNFASVASNDTSLTILNQSINTEYRAVVYCGTDSTLSNVVVVNNKPLSDCYCVPVYTTGCTSNDRISNVSLGAFVNSTGTDCGTADFLDLGYASYTSLIPSPQIIKGDIDTLAITNGTQGSSYYAVWIDFNNNGLFDANEKVAFTTTSAAANTITKLALSVPATTPSGQYRMRIRLVRNTSGSSITACGSYTFGETEDYLIDILDQPNCNTVALPNPITAIANLSSVCVSDNVFFDIGTVMPNVIGYTYQWESSNDAGASWNAAGLVNQQATDTFLVNTAIAYRLNILCNAVNVGYSNTLALVVNDPQLLTTNDSVRCGYGSVVLNATGSNGTTINWYENLSDLAAVAVGNTFATPSLNQTKTYYAAAAVGNSVQAWLGTGTNTLTGTPSPYYTSYWGSKNQYLIKASELIALGYTAGNISSIAFELENAGGAPLTNLTISMGHSSLTTLSTSFNTGLTQVYTSAVYVPVSNAINTHAFSTPFVWDGVSNIIVETCFNNTSSQSGHNVKYTTALGYNASLYNYSNTATVCAYTTGFTSTNRPNILFTQTACESVRQPVVANVNVPAAISASAIDSSICQGNSTTLNVSTTNPGYTFEWMPGNLTGSAQLVTPTVTTEYIVWATDVTTGPFEGCVVSDTIIVVVDSVARPVLFATADTICSGETVTLNVASYTSVGNNNLTTSSNFQNPFYHSYGGVKTQYMILASELQAVGFGAGSDLSSLALDFTTSNNYAFNSFSVSLGQTNQNALNATAWVGGMSTVYQAASITPVVGINQIVFDNTFAWDGVSNIVVQFCWSNNNSGSSSNTPAIKYGSTAFVSCSYQRKDAPNANTICAETTVYGTVSGRPWMSFKATNALVTPMWTPTALTTDEIQISPINTTNDYVVDSHILTLTNSQTGCTSSSSIDVVVKPQPVANILTPQTIICSNDLVGFYLDAQSSQNATSFDWNNGEFITPTYLVTMPGTYYLTVSNQFDCNDLDSVVITQVQPINTSIVLSNVSSTAATLDAGTGFATYLWSTFEGTQTIVVTEPGVYTVTVVDSNGCVSTSAPIEFVNLSINENGEKLNINIFPNPSNGIFSIQLDNLKAKELVIKLLDVSGKILNVEQLKNLTNSYTHSMNISDLPSGNYFIEITSNFGKEIKQIVVVR